MPEIPELADSIPPATRKPQASFLVVLGFIFALLAMGFPMIGVTVNLYLGAAMMMAALVLLAVSLWRWERYRGWNKALRASLLCFFGLACFCVVALQMTHQYRIDHPQIGPLNASPKKDTKANDTAARSDPSSATLSVAISKPKVSGSTRRVSRTSPVIAPAPNVQIDAPNNQGNVAGINNGTQNSYGESVPAPASYFKQQQLPALPEQANAPINPSIGDLKRGNPGVIVNVFVAATFRNPQFLFDCSAPCVLTEAAASGMVNYRNITYPTLPTRVGVKFVSPSEIVAGEGAEVILRSVNSEKITVLRAVPFVEPKGK